MSAEPSSPPAQHRRSTGTEQQADVVALRPLATPLPLAFLGLAAATTAFATVQVGWPSPSQNLVVACGVVVYAALAFELEGADDGTVLPTGRRTPVSDRGPSGVRSQL